VRGVVDETDGHALVLFLGIDRRFAAILVYALLYVQNHILHRLLDGGESNQLSGI